MPIPLTTTRDINGYQTTGSQSGRRFSDLTQYFELSATPATVTSVTVPPNPNPTFGGSRMLACFEFYDPAGNVPGVWILPAATPTLGLPSGTVTVGTQELNPQNREVNPGQVLQFISSAASVQISIAYYAIQS